MKKTLLGMLLGILSLGSHAAVYDFADIADGGGFISSVNGADTGFEGSWADVVGSAAAGIVDAGVTVTSTSSTGHVFFDSDTAGIGVCDDSDCVGDDDEEINSGETLTLGLSSLQDISGIYVVKYNHDIPGGGDIEINGVDFGIGAGGNILGVAALTGVNSLTFGVGSSGKEYYIRKMTTDPTQFSVIPIPGAAVLFGSALLGFCGIARKRRLV